MNKEPLLLLSVQFFHNEINSDEIIQNINIVPDIKRNVGEEWTPKNKNTEGKINEMTYVAKTIIKTNDIDIEFAIKNTNEILLKNINYINEFISSGGEIYYYITIVSSKKYTFELSPEIIRECALLGIKIGVELYADIENNDFE
jgi:hypothetical protein